MKLVSALFFNSVLCLQSAEKPWNKEGVKKYEWLAPSLKVAKKSGILKYSKGFLNNVLLVMDSENKDYENYLIAFTKASQRVSKYIEEAEIDLSDIEDPEYPDLLDKDGNVLENHENKNLDSDFDDESDDESDSEVSDEEDDDEEDEEQNEGTDSKKPVGWNKFAVNFLTVDSGDHKEYGVFLQMGRIRTDKPRLVFFQMNMNTFSKPTIFESDWDYSEFEAEQESSYVEQFESFVYDVMKGKVLSRDQQLLQKDEADVSVKDEL
jgi:hypothetical protein